MTGTKFDVILAHNVLDHAWTQSILGIIFVTIRIIAVIIVFRW